MNAEVFRPNFYLKQSHLFVIVTNHNDRIQITGIHMHIPVTIDHPVRTIIESPIPMFDLVGYKADLMNI